MTLKQKFGIGFLVAAGLLFPAAAWIWSGNALVAVLLVLAEVCVLVGLYLGYDSEGD